MTSVLKSLQDALKHIKTLVPTFLLSPSFLQGKAEKQLKKTTSDTDQNITYLAIHS